MPVTPARCCTTPIASSTIAASRSPSGLLSPPPLHDTAKTSSRSGTTASQARKLQRCFAASPGRSAIDTAGIQARASSAGCDGGR